jgi:hypothetical protein
MPSRILKLAALVAFALALTVANTGCGVSSGSNSSSGSGSGGSGSSGGGGTGNPPHGTSTISGTISPAAYGIGVTMTVSGTGTGTVTTDSAGNYSFTDLANGPYTVTPQMAGWVFTPASQTVTTTGTTVLGVNFTITQTYSISGTVGPPVNGVGATVTLSGGATGTTTVDSTGKFTFSGLNNGNYVVTPSFDGVAFTPLNQNVVVNNGDVLGVSFTGWGTLVVAGTVTPAASGSATVITLSGTASGNTITDNNGNYSFTGLSNGSYTITPAKSGVTITPSTQSITLKGSSQTAVNFTAPTGTSSISGTVGPTSLGSGAVVSLSGSAGASTTADSSGNYSFAGLLDGSYTITPSKLGVAFNPPSASVTVSGGNVTAVNFIGTSVSHSISGTISPAATGAGTTITLSGAASGSTIADSAGNYTFSGLGDGAYTITPFEQDLVFTPVSQNVTISGADVTGTNFTAASGTPACLQGSATADFFIAQNGNDTWSGTLPCPNSNNTDGPFASLSKAQTAVQGILKNPQGRTAPITVLVRQGTYFLTSPWSFTTADSGTSTLQVVWQNYPDESATISGGTRVQNWTNVSGNQWQAILPAGTQPFEQMFYNGVRRLRPRLGGDLGTYYRIKATVYLSGGPPPSPAPDPNCAVYVNGKGWECFDRFEYSASDPISGTWANLKSPYPQGDIELYDFEWWTVPKMHIKSVDTTNSIIYLTGPTQQADYNHGFVPTHRYLIENVKDAFNQAGQWFLDRSVTPMTLSYIANAGENPSSDEVIIPQQTQVLNATGLQYVTFSGLTFEHDNYVVPATGYYGTNEETQLPAAVNCYNCQHVTMDGVVVTQTAATGVAFSTSSTSATTAYNVFQNGAIYDVGGVGIRFGNAPVYTDTDANVPQFNTVQNSVIEGYGRMFPGAGGIAQGSGHDNLYTHNEIYDGYHDGIGVCMLGCIPGAKNSNGSFNNTASFNHVYNIYKGITDDGGGIYFNVGNANFTAKGNKILNNRVHDTTSAYIMDSDGYGGLGIYLDIQSGLVDVENNLVYRTSGANFLMPQGPPAPNQPNTIKNNIFAYGRIGTITQGTPMPYPSGQCPTTPILGFNATNNIFYFDRTSKWNEFYFQRGFSYPCGFPYTQYENFQSNVYWRTDGTFASDPQAFHTSTSFNDDQQYWVYYTFSQWQSTVGEDTTSLVKDPGFNSPAYPADDYTLPKGSPGAGFVVFDTTLPGRTSVTIETPSIDDTFPTQVLNPATDY